jgi:hypothetical protein
LGFCLNGEFLAFDLGGGWLTARFPVLSAKVEDQEEMLLARARAVHWIVDETEVPSQTSGA